MLQRSYNAFLQEKNTNSFQELLDILGPFQDFTFFNLFMLIILFNRKGAENLSNYSPSQWMGAWMDGWVHSYLFHGCMDGCINESFESQKTDQDKT